MAVREAELLRKHRIKNKLTQPQVADYLGIFPEEVGQYELGRNPSRINFVAKFLIDNLSDAAVESLVKWVIEGVKKHRPKNQKRAERKVGKRNPYYVKKGTVPADPDNLFEKLLIPWYVHPRKIEKARSLGFDVEAMTPKEP